MYYITVCYINGARVVYEGVVSEEDRRKLEAKYPGKTIEWKVYTKRKGLRISERS